LLAILESPWMPVYDSEYIPQDENLLTNSTNISRRKGCDSVLNTYVIDPAENLGACCGLTREQIPEMKLGSLKKKSMMNMINESFEDFLKIWIYVDGPEKILQWAANKDSSILWENKYAHICHACRELYNNKKVREIIKKHYEEKLVDIYTRFWLLTKYNTNSGNIPKLYNSNTHG